MDTAVHADEFQDPGFWKTLLFEIEKDQVVPIVGKDLLTLEGERFADAPRSPDNVATLYPFLAEKLAEATGLAGAHELAADAGFNRVVGKLRRDKQEITNVHVKVAEIVDELDQIPVPPALTKLAKIPFRLYVSTTFDGLLSRALETERGEEPLVVPYTEAMGGDLPSALPDPTVFHLFGKLAPSPSYAMTDEDILEFLHALQSDETRPKKLFDELEGRRLLFLGNGFSDWLARVVLRLTRKGPLAFSRVGAIVADGKPDPRFLFFLRNFTRGTLVFEGGGARGFVDALYAKWEEHEQGGQPAQDPFPVPEGSIFLSYAHEDREAAERVRAGLEAANMKVWLDKLNLRFGDDFDRVIHKAIESSSLFIPIISQHTLTPKRRYFRREWNLAAALAAEMAANRVFICPVLVDETPEGHEAVRADIWEHHARRLPEGIVNDDFIVEVRAAYRAYRTGP